ncbi:hypothetical protein KY386_02445 [Candidatus Parcubacteria bacterium]|nr:hypothetical protein [Candidatus Parcubacteria bacterium]
MLTPKQTDEEISVVDSKLNGTATVATCDGIYRCANAEHRAEEIFLAGDTFTQCECGSEWERWVSDNVNETHPTYLWVEKPGLRWGIYLAEAPVVDQVINIKQDPNPMTYEPYVGSYRIISVQQGGRFMAIQVARIGEIDPAKPLHDLVLTSI